MSPKSLKQKNIFFFYLVRWANIFTGSLKTPNQTQISWQCMSEKKLLFLFSTKLRFWTWSLCKVLIEKLFFLLFHIISRYSKPQNKHFTLFCFKWRTGLCPPITRRYLRLWGRIQDKSGSEAENWEHERNTSIQEDASFFKQRKPLTRNFQSTNRHWHIAQF